MELEINLNESSSQNAQKTKLSAEALKMQAAADDDEADLVPLKVAKSLSLPISRQPHQGVRISPTESSIQLIKSLMALLLEQDSVVMKSKQCRGTGQ